ncbi:MAG: transglutaminase domain-containing protein [Bacteroidales bacterium]|nr:transglutaminase domain-containing protein [Bacteroidales bacterium]
MNIHAIKGFLRLARYFPMMVLLSACLKSTEPGLPPEVIKVYEKTGFNRIEFTKTIGHYLDDSDSLKLRAAYYLIENLERQYTVSYDIKDTAGNTITIDPLSFPTDREFLSYWNTLDSALAGLTYKPHKFVLDRDTIRAELLISTIDLAFETRSQAIGKRYNETDFFNYVLPYRFGNEVIENWRTRLPEVFPELHTFAGGDHTPEEAIAFVNQLVDSLFSFDGRFIKQAIPQLTEQLLENRRGNYEDLAYLKAKMLRCCGIPATIDYTPYLADSVNGFYWAVGQNSEGKFIPLIPKGTDYLFDAKQGRIAKVYRRTFHKQPNGLFRLKKTDLTTPPFLGHYDYMDVTEAYFQSLNIAVSRPCMDTLVYLGVYNDKQWRAIDWAFCKNDSISFTGCKAEIDYRLLRFSNKKLLHYPDGFLTKSALQ